MTIGIDAGCLAVVDDRLKTGVYHFSLNLLKVLSELDKQNRYLLYSFRPLEQRLLRQFGPFFQNLVLRPQRGWMSLRLSLEFLFRKPDMFIGLSQAMPFFYPARSIVYVHDLAFEHFPECYKNSYKRLRRQARYAVCHSNKIIAVSYATKKDLIRLYGVKEDKIKVIYHGVNKNFSPQPKGKLQRIKSRYHLDNPYFLYVGSLKPIKNLPRLIEAFNLFLKTTRKNYQLVIVGSDYWLDKEIPKTIKKLKLENQILILGFVKDEDLPLIYSEACAFISPSLYEGFGMPILEAMACGCPVITANCGSLPEIAGDAAILIDPFDIKEIAQSLCQLSANQRLIDKLKSKGLEQSKKFSWQKCGRDVLKIINQLF